MTDEENRQQLEQQRAWARDLSKAEDRATLWKCTAIAIFLLALFCILELRGCLPTGGGWPDMT